MINLFKKKPKCVHEWFNVGIYYEYDIHVLYCPKCHKVKEVSKSIMEIELEISRINKKYNQQQKEGENA